MKKLNSTREKLLDITFDEIYTNGYSSTSVGTILKKASVPKGSMYHHFDSKKSLVIAMIKERLYPKMDLFFNYKKQENVSVYKSFENTILVISKNKKLVLYGCPLHRLMVELSSVDNDFDKLLLFKYEEMLDGVKSLLEIGITIKEFNPSLDSTKFAEFFISSIWGVLSLSPTISSSKSLISHSRFILNILNSYKI